MKAPRQNAVLPRSLLPRLWGGKEAEAPPSWLNIDPCLHTPAVLAVHLWLLCLNLQHDRLLTVKSNENEIKAEVLRASAQQPSLSAPLVYEMGPKKETNTDSLSAQATLNSDADRSSKRTRSKIDEVSSESNRWSGYRILVQTDVIHRSVTVLKVKCQKCWLAQCCLFQTEDRTKPTTNRPSPVITVQCEREHVGLDAGLPLGMSWTAWGPWFHKVLRRSVLHRSELWCDDHADVRGLIWQNYHILMLFVIMLKQTTCSITSIITTGITVEGFIFLVASPIWMSGKHWSKLHHALTGLGPNCGSCGELRGDETQSQNHFTETLNEFWLRNSQKKKKKKQKWENKILSFRLVGHLLPKISHLAVVMLAVWQDYLFTIKQTDSRDSSGALIKGSLVLIIVIGS